MEKTFTKLQKQIIKEWEKVEVKHPSMSIIAEKLGCSKQTVHQTIKQYQLITKQYGKTT